LVASPVAMHKNNTVHFGVIESFNENGESLYFVQVLLSSATESKFKITKLVIRFRPISGKKPDQIEQDQKSAGPDQTGYPVSS
jgi:hypothetical protein